MREAIDIAAQIALGLAKALEKEIVHRDIKPANILSTEDGRVQIVDFGLAKLAREPRLRRVGSTTGTIAYMSPEQAGGGGVDGRTSGRWAWCSTRWSPDDVRSARIAIRQSSTQSSTRSPSR